MKYFVLILSLFFLASCAHKKEEQKAPVPEQVVCEPPTIVKSKHSDKEEITKLKAKVESLKKDIQKTCWRAIKKTCQGSFECVERGVKVCESLKNE